VPVAQTEPDAVTKSPPTDYAVRVQHWPDPGGVLDRKLPYDPLKELTHRGQHFNTNPLVLIVNRKSMAKARRRTLAALSNKKTPAVLLFNR